MRGRVLGFARAGQPMLLHCGAVCGVEVEEGNNTACWALGQLSVTSSTIHKQIGPFWCWLLVGWFCVCSRTLWFFPRNSPVRLGVYPPATSPTGFFSQKVWGFISPWWNPGLLGLFLFPVVSPSLSVHKCGTALVASHHPPWSFSHCLALSGLCPIYPSPSLLPVWMNISSLSPSLSNICTVLFSVSSGCPFGCVR